LKGKILSARMLTKRNILELRKRAGPQVRRSCFRAAHRYPGCLGFTHCTWENGVFGTTRGFGGYRLEKIKFYADSLEKVYLHKYSYGTACPPPSSTHVFRTPPISLFKKAPAGGWLSIRLSEATIKRYKAGQLHLRDCARRQLSL